MSLSKDSKKILIESGLYLATSLLALWASYKLIQETSPGSSERRKSSAKGKAALARLQSSTQIKLGGLELNEHEEALLGEVVSPEDIEVGFNDIGGLEPIIEQLRESLMLLLYPNLFSQQSGGLLAAPKGILLYGPPGCGKTMLAKALAKESGATFINVPLSSLASKWYGESNKLIAGLFTLAKKLQPTIIFVDEIDALLRDRSSDSHEVTSTIKAEFLTLWDGLTTGENQILVLGATNRPTDIDAAFLRRMPKKFQVSLPDVDQRERILTLMLRNTSLDKSLSIRDLATLTPNRSPADLRELCREAAMRPVREHLRTGKFDPVLMAAAAAAAGGGAAVDGLGGAGMKVDLRPLRLADFFEETAVDGATAMIRDLD